MPYIHFTDEQKRQANLVDLSEFLRRRGEPLIVCYGGEPVPLDGEAGSG